MPAPQLDTEYCVAHNGSIVPVPGRDIFAQAWYQGGISVIDFTDSANPIEIAYFDRGPIMEEELITGGFWSVYYYEGAIYGTEITRGLDILKLIPSEYLSEIEIAAAALAYPVIGSRRLFNPQQQMPMTWPARPVVARAYIDQLLKDKALEEDKAQSIIERLDLVDVAMEKGGNNRLARQINRLELSVDVLKVNAMTQHRLEKLNATLKEIAEGLSK